MLPSSMPKKARAKSASRNSAVSAPRCRPFALAPFVASPDRREALDVLVFGDPQVKSAADVGHFERDIIDDELTDPRMFRHPAQLYRRTLGEGFTELGGGVWLSPLAGLAGELRAADIPIRDPFIHPDPTTKTYYLYAQSGHRKNSGYRGVEVYSSKDLLGVELCGVLKNIIAIGCR